VIIDMRCKHGHSNGSSRWCRPSNRGPGVLIRVVAVRTRRESTSKPRRSARAFWAAGIIVVRNNIVVVKLRSKVRREASHKGAKRM
jgi:hypothetical protein